MTKAQEHVRGIAEMCRWIPDYAEHLWYDSQGAVVADNSILTPAGAIAALKRKRFLLIPSEDGGWSCSDRLVYPKIIAHGQEPEDAIRDALGQALKTECDHDWIKLRNEVITSGEICTKCNAVRAEQALEGK